MSKLVDDIIKKLSNEKVNNQRPYLEALHHSPSFLDILNKQLSGITLKTMFEKNSEQEENKFRLAMQLISVYNDLKNSNSILDFFMICCKYEKQFLTYSSFESFQQAVRKCIQIIDEDKLPDISSINNSIVLAEIGFKNDFNFLDAFKIITDKIKGNNFTLIDIIGLSILFENTKLKNNQEIGQFVNFLLLNNKDKLQNIIESLLSVKGLRRQVGLRLFAAAENFLDDEDALQLIRGCVNAFIKISTGDNDPMTFKRLCSIAIHMPIGGENTALTNEEEINYCASILFPHVDDFESDLLNELVDFFRSRVSEDESFLYNVELTIKTFSMNCFIPSFVICQKCGLFNHPEFIEACFKLNNIEYYIKSPKMVNAVLDAIFMFMESAGEIKKFGGRHVEPIAKFLFALALNEFDEKINNKLADAFSLIKGYTKIFMEKFMKDGDAINDFIFSKCVNIIAEFDDGAKSYSDTKCKKINEIIVRLLFKFVVNWSPQVGRVVCILTKTEDIREHVTLNAFIEHCFKGEIRDNIKNYLMNTKNDKTLLRNSIVVAGFDDDKMIERVSKTIAKIKKEGEYFSMFFDVYAQTNQIKAVQMLKAFTDKKVNDRFIANTIGQIANNPLINLANGNKDTLSAIMTIIVKRQSESELSESFYKSLTSFLSSGIKTTEGFTEKIVKTPPLALIIPMTLENCDSSFKFAAPAIESIRMYINKESSIPLFSFVQKVLKKGTYVIPDDQYSKWTKALFAKVTSDVDAKNIASSITKSIKMILNESPMESLNFLREVIEEMKKRGVILTPDDPDIILKATEMVLFGQQNAPKALEFIASYFNLGDSYNYDLLDIQGTLIAVYKEKIPESTYQQLLMKCCQGTLKMHHTIIFKVLLDKAYKIVIENLDAVCRISADQEIHVYNIYVTHFGQFIKSHFEEIMPIIMKKQFTPFVKNSLTRSSLLKMGKELTIFDGYMKFILSLENVTCDTIESDFINVIGEYDPCFSVSATFSGEFLVIVAAMIGLIHFGKQAKKKQMYESLQKTTSNFCALLSVPKFDIGNDLTNLANTCQTLAECILRIPTKMIEMFFNKAIEMFDAMKPPVLSSIGGVAIFALSRIINEKDNANDLKRVAIELTQKAMLNKVCCDFLYICAARSFDESVIDLLPVDIINSYTRTLGNCICTDYNISDERVKLFYIMVKRSKAALPVPFSIAIEKCPEEGISTLIEIEGKDVVVYHVLFDLYFKGYTDAMQLIQMKAESEDKKVIATHAVSDINFVGHIEKFFVIFEKTKKADIIDWICLFIENMSDEFLGDISEKLTMFAIGLHRYIKVRPEIGAYVTRILSRIIQRDEPLKAQQKAEKAESEKPKSQKYPSIVLLETPEVIKRSVTKVPDQEVMCEQKDDIRRPARKGRRPPTRK